MRRRSAVWLVLLCLCALCTLAEDTREASACGYTETLELVSTHHPDLPLQHYAGGQLGLLHSSYARSYLVVAWRYLTGLPLDQAEQESVLRLWGERLQVDNRIGPQPAAPSAAPSAPSAPSELQVWRDKRNTIPGVSINPAPTIVTTATQNHAQIDNCLPNAFLTAAATLESRAKLWGAGSAEVKAWLAGQDVVFQACDGKTATPFAPLPKKAPARLIADRAYQEAARDFYLGELGKAESAFRQSAADKLSPWRWMARYMVVRCLTRRGMLAGPSPDIALLKQAEAEVDALLRDPTLVAFHKAAEHYRSFLRFRTDPKGQRGDLAVRLASQKLGSEFGPTLGDYTFLLDNDELRLDPSVPDTDRLTTWLQIVQAPSQSSFAKADKLYHSTHSEAWLVAALLSAKGVSYSKLEPLLRDAAAVAPGSPAFATAQYHALRLRKEGGAMAGLFREVEKVRAKLRPDEGLSTRNAFTLLALQTASSLSEALSVAYAKAAGTQTEDSIVVPSTGPTLFYPESAAFISEALPLSLLKAAVHSNALPDPLRGQLAASVFVRAELLGELAVARAVAPIANQFNPALTPYVAKVLSANGESERRLALLTLLIKIPRLSPELRAWNSQPLAEETVSSSYDSVWWCARSASPRTAAGFLSRAQRKKVDEEHKQLVRLGAGPSFLGREAVALARLLPKDPRVPEALHVAVAATRFGCRGPDNSKVSAEAFRTLHRSYPKSGWTEKTPYHY